MNRQPVCYQLFPTGLYNQVDELIKYLIFSPFEKPQCCIYCGSKPFYFQCLLLQMQKMGDCCRSRCNKEFKRLTEALIAYYRHAQLRKEIVKAQLSGLLRKDTIGKLGILKNSEQHFQRYGKTKLTTLDDWIIWQRKNRSQ